MAKEKFYMTTAIAYTSGKPHIGNTCFFGFQLDLLTVLIRTGLEEYIVSLLSFEAGDTVCQYNLVGITDVGFAGRLGCDRIRLL